MGFDSQEIVWGISERQDGSMKLLQSGGLGKSLENRRRFFAQSGLDSKDSVAAYLVHGTRIAAVTEADRGQCLPETDGLVTDSKGVILTVTAADCLPIYFFDPQHQAIGLAHAGWKGALQGMASKMAEKMRLAYGTDLKDLRVWIGPHIRHYEVTQDRAEKFSAYPDCVKKSGNGYLLDLAGIVKKQLSAVGVEQVEVSQECTHCAEEKFFSYYRDKPEEIQAMVAFIGLRT